MRSGAIGHTPFRLLFLGQAISALGDRLVPVALAFAVLDLTGSVTDLGIVTAAQTLPLIVFVLLGGVWADRLPRQLVMLGSDLVRALAQGATAALLLTGSATVAELIVLQAVYGTAQAFFAPASLGIVPQVVDPADLQQANALLGLTGNVAMVLGPAVAVVIVATIGPGWGLAFDAVTFLASAACLSVLRIAGTVGATRKSTLSELRAGWVAFRSRTWLWATVLFFTLYLGFVYSPWLVLGPAIARSSLGGVAAWAAISSALGIGSLAGGLLGLRWHPRHPLRASLLAFLAGVPALFVLVAAHAPLAAILVVALID